MAPTTAYATVANVQTLLDSDSGSGITIGVASTPTTTEVEGFLDQIAAEVNSVLVSNGYTVPVTGTNDLFLVKRYVSQKAAAMTYHAGYGGFGDVPARVLRWEAEYDAFIERLITKRQRLVDVAPRSRIGVIYAARYVED